MQVTLKPEIELRILDEVQAGNVANADEFLNHAVYHYLVARELGKAYSATEMDELIDVGLRQIEDGKTVDGEVVFDRLRQLSAGYRQRTS